MKTLGGKQLWTDQLHFRGWRIQQNAITGHHRLLDPQNWRTTWGSLANCRAELDKTVRERKLEPVTGDVIITLHGLMRSRNSMAKLVDFLRENTNSTICNFEYASTRAKVADHAAALGRVIQGLPSATRIHFVGHSLGNIVVRHYLQTRYTAKDAGGEVGAPIGRTVMFGPPNLGTELAARFARNPVLISLWGKSGNQLAREWESLQSQLATPRTEFGIIAGESFNNPLLSSESDLVVTVEETKLPGAADFMIIKALHSLMMNHPQSQSATARFLQHGYFDTETARQPIIDVV